MLSLVYVSCATKPFSSTELVTLLQGSRNHNARHGITGVLVYKAGNFMQAIEGEDSAVNALYDKIKRDRRHKSIFALLKNQIEERQFPEWSMGFQDLLDPEVKSLPAYSEFLDTPLTQAEFSECPSRAQKLLMSFKRDNLSWQRWD